MKLTLQAKQPSFTLTARNYTNECSPVDIDTPQDDTLDAEVPGGQTLEVKVQDSAENDFPDGQVQALFAANLLRLLINDYIFRITTDEGPQIYQIRRSLEPGIGLEDSAANPMPVQQIIDSGSPFFIARFFDTEVRLNGVQVLVLLASQKTGNIAVTDPQGNPVGSWNVAEQRWEVPASGIEVDFNSDLTEVNVTEVVNFTGTAPGADRFMWKLGADKHSFVQNPQFSCLIPGVYDVLFHAFTAPNGAAGGKEVQDYLTINGVLDAHPGAVLGAAPWLLVRNYGGAAARVRRTDNNAIAEIPFTNGLLDELALSAHVGANDGRVERAYFHTGSDYFEQTTQSFQPLIADSGNIIIDGANLPTLEFDGAQVYMKRSVSTNYWGSDRTKLFLAGIFQPKDNGSATNVFFSDYEVSGNNRSWRAWYDATVEKVNVAYSTTGLANFQRAEFVGITPNETVGLVIKVDTTQLVNDRIRAWKITSETVEELTPVVNGNLTGNIHLGTCEVMLGAQVPSNPSGHFFGNVTAGWFKAVDVGAAELAFVQGYLQKCLEQLSMA